MGLLVQLGGSETSVLGYTKEFGPIGETNAHLLQVQLPPWSAAVAVSLVGPEQDGW